MSRNIEDNWIECNYVRNRYRQVTGIDGEDDYIEVEIYGKKKFHIGKIDIGFLDRFKERTWGVIKLANSFYMIGRATKKFPYSQYFHRLVLPEVDIVDHKDGKTLDNRMKNLRDGSGVVVIKIKQTLLKTNTSGTTDVCYNKRDKSWCARWCENGKLSSKSFSIKNYGDEEAKKKAIKYRQSMHEIFGITNGDGE